MKTGFRSRRPRRPPQPCEAEREQPFFSKSTEPESQPYFGASRTAPAVQAKAAEKMEEKPVQRQAAPEDKKEEPIQRQAAPHADETEKVQAKADPDKEENPLQKQAVAPADKEEKPLQRQAGSAPEQKEKLQRTISDSNRQSYEFSGDTPARHALLAVEDYQGADHYGSDTLSQVLMKLNGGKLPSPGAVIVGSGCRFKVLAVDSKNGVVRNLALYK